MILAEPERLGLSPATPRRGARKASVGFRWDSYHVEREPERLAEWKEARPPADTKRTHTILVEKVKHGTHRQRQLELEADRLLRGDDRALNVTSLNEFRAEVEAEPETDFGLQEAA